MIGSRDRGRTYGVPLVACGAYYCGERGSIGRTSRELVEDVAERAREDTLDPSDLFNVHSCSISHSKPSIRSTKERFERVRELRATQPKGTNGTPHHNHTQARNARTLSPVATRSLSVERTGSPAPTVDS